MTNFLKMTFEILPPEIIYQVASHLSPSSLARLSQTSKSLRVHAENDLHWARFVKENVRSNREGFSPFPYKTWKELYLSPYWFIPRSKLWFSDYLMTGLVVIARYDPLRACIEGYRLVVEQGAHRDFETWEWNPAVVIPTFNPKVRLWLDDPVIKLDLRPENISHITDQEIRMHTGAAEGIQSAISLCYSVPEELQHPSSDLWPPAILPAKQRTTDGSEFKLPGRIPRSFSEVSRSNFRIRRWLEVGGPLRIELGPDVMTFGTLPEDSYIPTEKKPWQGFWVGDYSGHGCEFLVVLQRDVDSRKLETSSTGMSWQSSPTSTASIIHDDNSIQNAAMKASSSTVDNNFDANLLEESTQELEDESCYGRLEAVKLTGDPNVPRGQYTWIAEDIGSKGLIRIAHEQVFKGARVVKSLGHVAEGGFQNGKCPGCEMTIQCVDDMNLDRYTSSQLIMISHDSLAQYWEVRIAI